MSTHDQVVVQVNVLVDSGIAPLIRALSKFPKLQTLESCQGDAMTPAWVCFYYGDDEGRRWRPLAEFVLEHLGPWLLDKVGDSAEVSVHRNGVGMPQGELIVRPGTIKAVVTALTSLARSWG